MTNTGGTQIIAKGHEADWDREFYVLHLATPMVENSQYSLNIKFTAVLNDKLKGFYRSEYTDPITGEKKYNG